MAYNMIIGYDLYDRFTMEHFLLCQSMILTTSFFLLATVPYTNTAFYLTDKGAEINTTTESKRLTPLHIAALMGHVEIVKLLLLFNADVTIIVHFSTSG
jgi:ankyrin repeat protein